VAAFPGDWYTNWYKNSWTSPAGGTFTPEYRDHPTLEDLLKLALVHTEVRAALAADPLGEAKKYGVGSNTRAINVWIGKHPKGDHNNPDSVALLNVLIELLAARGAFSQCSA